MVENTSENLSQDYLDWKNSLKNKSPREISQEIKNRILATDELDDKSKKVFNDIYDYVFKMCDANKPIKMDLMKIYLQDIKGHDVTKMDMYPIWLLLGFCGIKFDTVKI